MSSWSHCFSCSRTRFMNKKTNLPVVGAMSRTRHSSFIFPTAFLHKRIVRSCRTFRGSDCSSFKETYRGKLLFHQSLVSSWFLRAVQPALVPGPRARTVPRPLLLELLRHLHRSITVARPSPTSSIASCPLLRSARKELAVLVDVVTGTLLWLSSLAFVGFICALFLFVDDTRTLSASQNGRNVEGALMRVMEVGVIKRSTHSCC